MPGAAVARVFSSPRHANISSRFWRRKPCGNTRDITSISVSEQPARREGFATAICMVTVSSFS